MARKLRLGCGLVCCAALLTAGCQSTGGSRFAGNNSHKGPAIARQATPPPQPTPVSSNFPIGGPANSSGFSPANGYPQSPNMGPVGNSPAYPTNPNVTPISNQSNNPPVGPQGGLGTPATTSNRNVTYTQPTIPLPPQAPVSQPNSQLPTPPALPTPPQLPPSQN